MNVDVSVFFGERTSAHDSDWFPTIEYVVTCNACKSVSQTWEHDPAAVTDWSGWTEKSLRSRPIKEVIAAAEYWGIVTHDVTFAGLIEAMVGWKTSNWTAENLGWLSNRQLRTVLTDEVDTEPHGMSRDEMIRRILEEIGDEDEGR